MRKKKGLVILGSGDVHGRVDCDSQRVLIVELNKANTTQLRMHRLMLGRQWDSGRHPCPMLSLWTGVTLVLTSQKGMLALFILRFLFPTCVGRK